jgi:putative oxidoreductase
MKNVISLVSTIYTKLAAWDALPLLLIRLSIGSIFIQTGLGKLMHFGGTVNFFASLGIPYPVINAAAASSIEFFGGILVIAGLLTRPAAAKLAFVMVIAILTAHLAEIETLSDLIRVQAFDYLLFFVLLLFTGAGKLSIDHWIKTRFFSK